MAAPPPSWVILRAIPRVSEDDLPDHADLSLALAAPPRLAHLTVSPRVSPPHPDPHDKPSFPWLLAADPASGLLLLITPPPPSTSPPAIPRFYQGADGVLRRVAHITYRADPDHVVLHLPSAAATRLPARNDPFASVSANLGVVAAPDAAPGAFMVAGFQFIVGGQGAMLLCFSSQTGEWVTKAVRNPLPRWIWNFDGVVAHDGKLWWVDAAAGLLACDPFADHPDMAYVRLPEADRDDSSRGCGCYYCSERAAASRRRVVLSDGKFRCVEMSRAHQAEAEGEDEVVAPTVTMRTLADPETAEWTLDYEVCFADIWAADSYRAAGLPEKAPDLVAFVHPKNADVVYIFLDEHLFGVDMRARNLVECEAHGMDASASPSQGGVSKYCVLACELPPELTAPAAGVPGEVSDNGVKEESEAAPS
ncbi:hypothetical protein ACP70R_030785 [Stipagrostis hirtigluma subsp. patula]